jgi:hypothetical protein
MLKVVTVVQQIMTEVSGAQSQEEQIVAITKIVLKPMNQSGHWSSDVCSSDLCKQHFTISNWYADPCRFY